MQSEFTVLFQMQQCHLHVLFPVVRGDRGSRDSEAMEGTEGAALRFRMSRNVSDAHWEVKAAQGKADDKRQS